MSIMSKADYARHRRVARSTITRHVQKGLLPELPDGRIDSVEADLAWEENIAPRRGGPGKAGAPPAVRPTAALLRATTAIKVYEAQMQQLKLLQMTGELVRRKRVERAAFAWARAIRDAWTAWPARIAPRFSADVLQQLEQGRAVDQRFVNVLLEKYVHEHLIDLSDAPPPVD